MPRGDVDAVRLRIKAELERGALAAGPELVVPHLDPEPTELQLGLWTLSLRIPLLSFDTRKVVFSLSEHRILKRLALRAPGAVSREELDEAAGLDAQPRRPAYTLDNQVCRLRCRLGGTGVFVDTVKSFGYRLRIGGAEATGSGTRAAVRVDQP